MVQAAYLTRLATSRLHRSAGVPHSIQTTALLLPFHSHTSFLSLLTLSPAFSLHSWFIAIAIMVVATIK